MRCFPLCALVTFVLAGTVTAQDPPRVDRYWTEFEIAQLSVSTAGVNGGIGGFTTDSVPVLAQAVLKVEEGQRFTWEWVGLTEPGLLTVEGFPNIVFEAVSDDTFEYRDIEVDLNPVAPNKWGSGEHVLLGFNNVEFDFHYESFSFSSDTNAVFQRSTDFWWPAPGQIEPTTDFGFYPRIAELDYAAFPQSLMAVIELESSVQRPWTTWQRGGSGFRTWDFATLTPMTETEIEPFLAITELNLVTADYSFHGSSRSTFLKATLHHTPTGDANNDGTVDFADFIILSRNFQVAAAARWDDGDFDEDGDVDFGDFIGLSRNFGGGSVAAVPEPTVNLLMILGASILMKTRRSRTVSAFPFKDDTNA